MRVAIARANERTRLDGARFEVLSVLVISMLVGACGAADTPTEQAAEFWEHVAAGDRDAAIAAVDPAELKSGNANTFGRAGTLEDQFDWYDAVGWEWTLEDCLEDDTGTVEATATARNEWSDALGVEPVTATFDMQIGEAGITRIDDPSGDFIRQWSPMVFEVFADWVATNHPEDASIMFDFDVDVNPEILDLYEVNTARFVEARGG